MPAPPLHLLTPAHAASPAIAVYLVTYALPLGLTSVEVGVRCGAAARAAGHILYRTAMAFFLAGCASRARR